MTVALIIVAFLAGYVVGLLRPLRTLNEWNWRRVIHGRAAVTAADVALFAVLHPGKAAHVWRHRNDPPRRLPAPTVSKEWAARVRG